MGLIIIHFRVKKRREDLYIHDDDGDLFTKKRFNLRNYVHTVVREL